MSKEAVTEQIVRTIRFPKYLMDALKVVCKDGILCSSVNHAVVLAVYRLLLDEPWHTPCNNSYLELTNKVKNISETIGVQRKGALAEKALAKKQETQDIQNKLLKRAGDAPRNETPWVKDQVFLDAWKDYPKVGRERSSRRKSWNVWRKMPLVDRMQIASAIKLEKSTNSGWAGGYVPGFHRWLQDEKWRDVMDVAKDERPRPVLVEESSHELF